MCLHIGHSVGIWKTRSLPVRREATGPRTWGMTSPCALDDDGVADTDVAAKDVVLVVEGGELDGGAAHYNGLKLCEGVEGAGAPTFMPMLRSLVVACSAGNL